MITRNNPVAPMQFPQQWPRKMLYPHRIWVAAGRAKQEIYQALVDYHSVYPGDGLMMKLDAGSDYNMPIIETVLDEITRAT
jgi:hypothetical protein